MRFFGQVSCKASLSLPVPGFHNEQSFLPSLCFPAGSLWPPSSCNVFLLGRSYPKAHSFPQIRRLTVVILSHGESVGAPPSSFWFKKKKKSPLNTTKIRKWEIFSRFKWSAVSLKNKTQDIVNKLDIVYSRWCLKTTNFRDHDWGPLPTSSIIVYNHRILCMN